jgi:hypothetical protein
MKMEEKVPWERTDAPPKFDGSSSDEEEEETFIPSEIPQYLASALESNDESDEEKEEGDGSSDEEAEEERAHDPRPGVDASWRMQVPKFLRHYIPERREPEPEVNVSIPSYLRGS